MSIPPETDVLIVGAGPVGLVTAIALARRGVDFVIVDALAERQNQSRAAVIHARTLAALAGEGLAAPLIDQGMQVPAFRVRDRAEVLIGADFGTLDAPFPFLLMIPQDETEAIFIDKLRALGREVIRPARVSGIERTSGGAIASIATAGGARMIRARRVVGADGQHSVVREAAGIAFDGTTYGSFLLADVRLDWPIGPGEVSLFFSSEGTLVVAPMSRGRHRVVAQLVGAPAEPGIADVQAVIDARGPMDGGRVREVLWGSRFRVSHRIADRFHAGPVLLAGDAAHVHSPAGGQGMNLGLRDGIAAAVALSAPDSGAALAVYARDQRRAAEAVLRLTDRLTRVATLEGRMARRARNRIIATAGRFDFARGALARQLAGYG